MSVIKSAVGGIKTAFPRILLLRKGQNFKWEKSDIYINTKK